MLFVSDLIMANYGDDIVVSGIGGYFPGCKNIAEWKRQIFENEIYLEEKWAKGKKFNLYSLQHIVEIVYFISRSFVDQK